MLPIYYEKTSAWASVIGWVKESESTNQTFQSFHYDWNVFGTIPHLTLGRTLAIYYFDESRRLIAWAAPTRRPRH
jgi:hypothetical protein